MKKAAIMLGLLFTFGIASAQTDKKKADSQPQTDSLAKQQPPINPSEAYTTGFIPDTSKSYVRSGAQKPKGVTGNQPNPPKESQDKRNKKTSK
jgi:hypothetical protein